MRRTLLSGLFVCLASCSSSTGAPVATSVHDDTLATLRRLGALPTGDAGALALTAVVPARATAPLRLGEGDVWLEIEPEAMRPVEGLEAEKGTTVFRDAAPDVDLVYVRTARRVEELRLARTTAAAVGAAWSLRRGPGVAAVQVVDGRVEVVDGKGTVRLASEPAWAIDARGVKRPLTLALHGARLEAKLDTAGLTAPVAVDPAWSSVAYPSALSRVAATLTRLSTGKVLLAGGLILTTGARLSTAEVYDPATNTWTAASPMAKPRSEHTANTLGTAGSKKVLLVGGHDGTSTMTTAEIYDETTNSFGAPIALSSFATSSGSSAERRGHAAVTLGSGEVLVIGGRSNMGLHNSMFSFSTAGLPQTLAGGALPIPLLEPSAAVLGDGRVLVASGRSISGGGPERYVRDAYLVTIAVLNASFTTAASLPVARVGATVVVPAVGPNAGRVMLVGGAISSATSESVVVPSQGGIVYDPTANAWSPIPSLMATRRNLAFGGLVAGGGKLLVTGGVTDAVISGSANADAEILDLTTMAWANAGNMMEPRAAHSGVVLADGSMLLVGGVRAVTDGVLTLPTVLAEKFASQPNGSDCDADGQCASGHCVDRTCCDKPCTGQCEACDVSGSRGTCKVVTGAPHGARTACRPPGVGDAPACAETCNGVDTTCKYAASTVACSVDACAAGVETHANTCDGAGKCKDTAKSCGDYVCDAKACKTTCATKADCANPAHFCEAGKCIPQQASGSACTRDEACATGLCVDGVCCESKCDGQCQACDVPGQAGKCVAIKGKPHGKRADCDKDATDACKSKACDGTNTAACAATVGPCSPYACDDAEKVCKKACATDVDCGAGYECDKTARCVPRTSKCIGAATLQAADGSKTTCTAYVCRDGACLDKCTTSNECQNGYACDGTQCVSASAPPPASDGGCSAARVDLQGGAAGALGLAVGLLAARRGRRRR